MGHRASYVVVTDEAVQRHLLRRHSGSPYHTCNGGAAKLAGAAGVVGDRQKPTRVNSSPTNTSVTSLFTLMRSAL
jgi:hypothetical protein